MPIHVTLLYQINRIYRIIWAAARLQIRIKLVWYYVIVPFHYIVLQTKEICKP